MTRRLNFIFIAMAIIAPSSAFSAPITVNTEEARIIVTRPIDLWSGDLSSSKDILDAYKAKKVSYFVTTGDDIQYRGFPTVFQGVPDHPVTKGVEKRLNELNFKLANSVMHYFHVGKAVPIEASEFPALMQIQQSLFKRMVVDQGDPDTLPSRAKGKKLVGGLLSLGFMAASANTLGLSAGTQFAVGSGIAGDLYRVAAQYRDGIAPISLADIDLNGYRDIEIRKVSSNQSDRVGQIIIGYKNGKTPEAEQTALIQAIVTLAGADTTHEAIEQAREEDLLIRKTIWASCTTDESCMQTMRN